MRKKKSTEVEPESEPETVEGYENTAHPQPEPEPIAGLTPGRMVHFVTEDGEHRPAVIVRVWPPEAGAGHDVTGCCNLQVFTDGTNDGFARDRGLTWKTSVAYAAEPTPGTWHFIERV